MGKRRPSGDGMVRKREDGRWEGRIVVGHKENGDSIFRYVSAGSQKALAEKLHREMSTYRGVDLTENSRMTLGEWLDQWLEELVAPSVRESTLEGYRHHIQYHIKPRLGSKPISKITPDDVRKLYRDVQNHGRIREDPEYGHALSASSVRRLHGVLHLAMDAAVRARLIPQNPTQGVTLPKKETAPRKILNDAQLERFMEEIRKDPIWSDFFYTELTTGLRKGEICGLMCPTLTASRGPSPSAAPSTAEGAEASLREPPRRGRASGSSPCRPARRSCCKSGKSVPTPSGSSATRFCRSSPCRRTWPTTG